MTENLHIGIDIGSKTIKIVLENNVHEIVYSSYERHLANVKETLQYALETLLRRHPGLIASVGVTGSAGMQLAQLFDLRYIQEVVAARLAIEALIPQTDVAIEIGGEDSKILFITGGEEYRMNDTCAGGTGGFIDTIAGMLDTNAEGLNYMAHGCKTVYPIASRCAVFAQSDVRPLLNEGVKQSDIAGSVFAAVATQCISGLACGRPIRGKVALLGGPLHFLSALRDAFKKALLLSDDDLIVPIEGHLFVAQGASINAWNEPAVDIDLLRHRLVMTEWHDSNASGRLEPLFASSEEYGAFKHRHEGVGVAIQERGAYEGRAYLGIDSGSTSIKCVLMSEGGKILYHYYKRSAGDLIESAKDMFKNVFKRIPKHPDKMPTIQIAHVTATGYGEEFLKKAFMVDSGEVETIAHMRAAKELVPDASFILDIGGQDMKCLFMHEGRLENVVLNEACSSGCGALISGFAWSMNVKLNDFVKMAIEARHPVDLGTRCTVFMTSRVRHAQKEGASIGDISAGLAYSIVRNVLYKVIRIHNLDELGDKIVVQGGTFCNDAVLRAFELLTGRELIRPNIAEFMGAYGAALIARERAHKEELSTLLSAQQIKDLNYSQTTSRCEICQNACILIRNTFSSQQRGGGVTRSFITGNRCERGGDAGILHDKPPNLPLVRNRLLFQRKGLSADEAWRGSIGIPRALRSYEDYPFWHAFFTDLGFQVVLSGKSNRGLFHLGLETIPSESVCYPAKLAHGHVEDLVSRGVDAVFLPYTSGMDAEHKSCPVLQTYSLVLGSSIAALEDGTVLTLAPKLPSAYCRQTQSGDLSGCLKGMFKEAGLLVGPEEVDHALDLAYTEFAAFEGRLAEEGRAALRHMRQKGARGVVMAGHPYHIDPEINHALPDLLASYGYTVFTPDMLPNPLSQDVCPVFDSVWEYPAGMGAAAQAVVQAEDIDYLAVYSFACGIDAMMLDTIREYLESHGRVFTSLKIDEMSDLTSTRIRIRSMMHAVSAASCIRSSGDAANIALDGNVRPSTKAAVWASKGASGGRGTGDASV